MNRLRLALTLGSTVLALLFATQAAVAADVPRMSVAELNTRLGEPGLAVIDTRAPADWLASSSQVRGAVRRNPNAVAAWAGEYTLGQPLVVYCA